MDVYWYVTAKTPPPGGGLQSEPKEYNNKIATSGQHHSANDHHPFGNHLQQSMASPMASLMSPMVNTQKEAKELATPTSTPTTVRKTRRRSNLFLLSNKKHQDDKYKNGEVGVGRAIPVKQGYLYKKSVKTLNKEWKKKYVTLTTDGHVTYHPSLHDYMDDVNGKAIPLKHTTVKIPGQKPRGSRAFQQPTSATDCDIHFDFSNLSIADQANGTDQRPSSSSTNSKSETPHGERKKRHRRGKSGGKNKDEEDSDGNEFIIVSLENKQWHFEAATAEDRDCWVSAIEQQILTSLQNMESEKSKYGAIGCVDAATVQNIRTVPGNNRCIDCDCSNPDWASLNLGALMCIECSGIHRNLGTHISKVRSLELDDWLPGHIQVMMALGNIAVNSIWECRLNGRSKPTPNSSREEKERWIRAKYNQKEFLAPISDQIRIEHQLLDTVLRSDVRQLSLVLAHFSTNDQVNLDFYNRDLKTPLHLAAARGNVAIVQLLLWNNANPKAMDAEGKTPVFYAKSAGHKEVEELLTQTINGLVEVNGLSNGRQPAKTRHIGYGCDTFWV